MNFSVSSGSTSEVGLVDDTADPEKRGCTLIRLIMDFWMFPSIPGAVSGRQVVTMGIGVVSDDAFAAGSSGLPNPEVDGDYPVGGWLWRHKVPIFDETLATTGPLVIRIKEDLRAMRKLDRSTVALMMKSVSNEGTSFTVQWMGIIRALYKLP